MHIIGIFVHINIMCFNVRILYGQSAQNMYVLVNFEITCLIFPGKF